MAKYVEEEVYTSELLPSPVACVNELFSLSTDDQNDLILAAELGKALLERNRGLEARIAQLQLSLEDADKENASLHRQLIEARQKIRTYEELDLRNSELERECDRLRDALTKEKLHTDRIAQRIRELELESDGENAIYKAEHRQSKCPDCLFKDKQEAEVRDRETVRICDGTTQTDLRWLMEPIPNREDRDVQHESELDSVAVRDALEALTAAHKENKTLRESLANAVEAQHELERRNAALREELFEREDRLRVENFLVIGSDSQVLGSESDAISTSEKAKVKSNRGEASRSSLKAASASSTKQKRVLARLETKYAHMIAKYDSLLFDLRTRAGATVSRSATLPNLLHVGSSTNINGTVQAKHLEPIDDAEDDQSELDLRSNRESVELSTDQHEKPQVSETETTCEGGEPQYRRLFRDLYDLIHRSLNDSATQAVRSAAEHCQNLVDVRFDPAEIDIDPTEWDDIGEYVSG